MALPKIETPTYELTLPSQDIKVKFRPFSVREEKVLMMAQEAYARHGMDISQNIGVLTSLYTRGSFDYLARQRIQQGGSPQINTFGYFVEKNITLTEEILFN